MTEASAFIALFLSAFLAATLIPAQSELGLAYLIINTDYSMVLLITIASLGNTTGATLNWFIGRGFAASVGRSEKIKTSMRYLTMMSWYKKYGQWTLLLSWAPFIGDPITVIAGIFKVSLKTFLLIVALAKTTRYIFIATFTEKFILGQ